MKSLLICLFLPLASFAQGTVLFAWHGQSNIFQASFEVTAAEMLPGAIWNSDVFSNSITITSLSGATYHNDSPSDYAAGGTYANGTGPYFSMALLNSGTGSSVSPHYLNSSARSANWRHKSNCPSSTVPLST